MGDDLAEAGLFLLLDLAAARFGDRVQLGEIFVRQFWVLLPAVAYAMVGPLDLRQVDPLPLAAVFQQPHQGPGASKLHRQTRSEIVGLMTQRRDPS